MNHDELETKLLELPAQIKEKEHVLLKLTEESNIDSMKTNQIESEIKTDIGLNLNFKNDAQRKGACELRLKEHAQYQELIKKCQEDRPKIRTIELEIAYLHDMFRAYLAIAGIWKQL